MVDLPWRIGLPLQYMIEKYQHENGGYLVTRLHQRQKPASSEQTLNLQQYEPQWSEKIQTATRVQATKCKGIPIRQLWAHACYSLMPP